MVKSFKGLLEDVYAADRKEKQWVDPATGKTKKRKIQAHRIQFAASKLHKGEADLEDRPDYLKTEEHMEDLTVQLFEVLSKDAEASDWIHDFVHSTNPKFEGKSKKERIKMALGAYYAKQRNEEVELSEGDHDPYFRAQENKRSAAAAHQQGDHLAYHLHMADHHDDLAHWHQLRGRNHVSDQHLNKAEYHAHLANELLHKEKHGIKEEFNVWSIKNTKTGQVYKYSKYPITKHSETLQKIRAAGGDHIHATPHKDDKPVNEGVNDRPKSTEAKSTATSFKVETPWTKSKSHSGNVIDKSGAKHTPQSRARHLARMALAQMQKEDTYKGLEKEDKKGLPTALIKKSKKAIAGDTVEGWDHPHDAVKESYEEETNMSKTYQEFMEAMIATKVAPNVTRYTGGSYGNAKGARYGNTDYDKETLDTKDDEGTETQKRGRGRPAGSKSGARGPRIK